MCPIRSRAFAKQNNVKKILVTGGAGFIGSNLCQELLKDGHEVVCVDSFFSGKMENIRHLLADNRFKLIQHNIIQPLNTKFDRLDEIYNLACPASPVQYQFDPILTLRTSVNGMQNMLDLARKYGAKILQTSTSEVYGDPLEHPQKESYFGNVDCLGKRACYDEGKRAAETLCKDYATNYGVDARIVRLFNVYGPKMMFNDGRVISNFILQALLSEDITVHGEGKQSRSFMYIDDLISAFKKLMDMPKETIGWQPTNLGNPDERTIKSLAEDIKKISGSASKIIFLGYETIPERTGDPQQRCPDISRAQAILDWRPTVGFDDGLRKTVEDFKARLGNKTRILVFAPAYLPFKGPAETAVQEITDRLIGYDFDLITAKTDSKLAAEEKIGRVNVYRVGAGRSFDKYLLPLLASIKAGRLHKKHDYQAAWAIMASYGSLAAVIFSFFSRVAFLVSLFEGKIDNLNSLRRKIFTPLYKIIFRRANRFQIIAGLDQQQLAWLEDEKKLQALDLSKGADYVAKKTKEKFQELEIISSRL